MRHFIFLLFFLVPVFNTGNAQILRDFYFQGYEKAINGFAFTYHSPLPDVNASLLVRANQNYSPIEWATERVVEPEGDESVSFIWMYGVDTDINRYNFDLYVNGDKYLTFLNPADNDKSEWSVTGRDGAMLTFFVTRIDRHNDQMGFAVLTLPKSAASPGQPVVIKIDGEDAGSDIWYMTFKAQIQERITVAQEKVVAKREGHLFFITRFDFTHLGEETTGTVTVEKTTDRIQLKPGHNYLEMLLPVVDAPSEYTATIEIGDQPAIEKVFTLEPVKEWTVYLVQHTHTDIGYTRPQTEILPEHLRYIDYALDYCDLTDSYPDNARFRWTCEASWAVREYLKSRPAEQIERLVERINEGRIEVTGMFFNYSEIVDEAGLAAQTRVLRLFKDNGISVTAAMQNDVNGIGWCMPDYFQGTGVKYLIMGQHGHRARVPFDMPTAFWWESPSGNRLLAKRSEHYMHGNTLGLTTGDTETFRQNLTEYLAGLEDKGYPFSHTAFQYSGYLTDNAPPSTVASEVVKEWSEKYEWPRLRIAVASEFMRYLEDNEAENLPVKRVAWPDWWTDGFGSAMNETKAIRTTHSDMIANTGLLSMAILLGAQVPGDLSGDISAVQDAMLFYDEHTFGAAESIYDPLDENTVIQWSEKAAYAWEAVKKSRMLREKVMGFIQSYIEKSELPSIAIFNTLNWTRSGLVTVFIDHEVLPNDKAFQIIDYEGNTIEAQALESRSDGTYWGLWAENIPAMGYKLYQIKVGNENRVIDRHKPFNNILENDFYTVNVEDGKIISLFDKELQQELLDTGDTLSMGQFIYERLGNRHQMERFTVSNIDTVYVPLDGERYNLTGIEVSDIVEGPVWKSLYAHGNIPICTDDRGVNMEIRLYNKEKRIDLIFDMHKLPVTSPEAVYVVFPFGLNEDELSFEAQGGLVFPGINQLEGTASDWNTVQNFVSVRNRDTQIVFGSNDVPLVQLGAINTGRFYYTHRPETSHIYSWVLNNYWTTNFRASQEGEMKWSYYITSSEDNTSAFASRFGWGSRIPLLTRIFPEGKDRAGITTRSLIDIDQPNILSINATPAQDGNGIILHIRETNGTEAVINKQDILSNIDFRYVSEVNVLEDVIRRVEESLVINSCETKFIKIHN